MLLKTNMDQQHMRLVSKARQENLKSLCRDEGRNWESQPCAVLRHAPSSPAAPLVTTNNGKSSNENSGCTQSHP